MYNKKLMIVLRFVTAVVSIVFEVLIFEIILSSFESGHFGPHSFFTFVLRFIICAFGALTHEFIDMVINLYDKYEEEYYGRDQL